MPDQVTAGQGGLRRLIETRSGEYAPEVYPQTPPSIAVATGRFYWAGTGRQEIAAAGNVRATLTNPANSGRNLYIARMTFFSTIRAWCHFFLNPTTGLPNDAADLRIVNNAILGAPPGLGVLRADNDTLTALSGGTDTGSEIGVGPDRPRIVDCPPFILTPGNVLGMNANFGAAVAAAVNLFWWERDV